MITEAGGKEKVLSYAGATCIILAEEQREVIARRKGKKNISEFVREAIMACDIDTEDRIKVEIGELKKENEVLKGKLKAYKQKKMIITQERRTVMAGISKDFTVYLLKLPNASQGHQQNWLDSRCKGTGITPIEMRSYIENPDVFSDKMSEEEKGAINL